MSKPRIPPPATLLLSVLSARWEDFWPGLLNRLTARLGPVALESTPLPFIETSYYDAELGTPITRRILSFTELVMQDRLAEIKTFTNTLETEYARADGRRVFNLDPGLLTLERLVLATGKNFTHRVYLKDGIWADLTLIFTKGKWTSLPWTFSDYGGEAVQKHLTVIRNGYHEILKQLGHPTHRSGSSDG